MAWKKHYITIETPYANFPNSKNRGTGDVNKEQNSIPEAYNGPQHRLSRYAQYDYMDMDPQISSSLDVISDFCTQNLSDKINPFTINYGNNLDDNSVQALQKLLKWITCFASTTTDFFELLNLLVDSSGFPGCAYDAVVVPTIPPAGNDDAITVIGYLSEPAAKRDAWLVVKFRITYASTLLLSFSSTNALSTSDGGT